MFELTVQNKICMRLQTQLFHKSHSILSGYIFLLGQIGGNSHRLLADSDLPYEDHWSPISHRACSSRGFDSAIPVIGCRAGVGCGRRHK